MKKLLAIPILTAALGFAQTPSQDSLASFAFSYRVAGPVTLTPVAPQSYIIFPDTTVGKTSTITLQIVSSSTVTSTYTISPPQISGPGYSGSQFSGTVAPGGAAPSTITLNFTPTASGPANGLLQFSLVAPTGQQFAVFFNLFSNALSPQFITSFILPTTGNQTAIQSGATLAVPDTPVNGSSATTFVITNTGTGAGMVTNVAITGSAFTLASLPLVPGTVIAGSDFRFQIVFKPLALQQYTGSLTVTAAGQTSTFTLTGQGTNSTFSYAAGGKTVQPGATIMLPQVNTQASTQPSSSVTINVSNTGNADGTIGAIAVIGSTDFAVPDAPILPLTLHPGGIAVFTVTYTPKAVGTSTAQLRIGNDLFNLSAAAVGSALLIQVEEGATRVTVQDKGVVAVPNTVVGDKRIVTIDVTNNGGDPASLDLLSASGAGFTLMNAPPLPVTLTGTQSVRVQVVFTPTAIGPATGALVINDMALVLSGAGDAPPPVPQVTFTGVSSSLNPLQQPAVGIQLASPYPYDLTGVLTLTFLPTSFVDDPAIQFANGARVINFTVPANTTQAVFGQLGKAAPFQTGTLAGSVGFAITLADQTADVTPKTPPALSTAIAPGAPQVTSVRLGTQQSTTLGNTVTLLVSGYSTARAVSQLGFQLTGAPNTNLQTTSLTTDVSSAFTNWYTNPSSKVFGSQFTVLVTLTLTGDPTALQSVAVTATNAQGTSAPKSVTLR